MLTAYEPHPVLVRCRTTTLTSEIHITNQDTICQPFVGAVTDAGLGMLSDEDYAGGRA